MSGHLARWMQDATNNILTEFNAGCYADMELSESAMGDLQAARELEELVSTVKDILREPIGYTPAEIRERRLRRQRVENALLAMED